MTKNSIDTIGRLCAGMLGRELTFEQLRDAFNRVHSLGYSDCAVDVANRIQEESVHIELDETEPAWMRLLPADRAFILDMIDRAARILTAPGEDVDPDKLNPSLRNFIIACGLKMRAQGVVHVSRQIMSLIITTWQFQNAGEKAYDG